ncbi:MAG TPA: tyrosine-protein phosphatase [Isosphaeraceae bacterium]|nr:tyrosine-protein phosphatase [Isosphaeraceae bacterium]
MRRWSLRSLAVLLLPLGLLGWNRATNNFATLAPGRVYRSGQMPAESLARTIRAKGIRTVLNLRGPNAAAPWYRAERSATLGAGATQIDIAMSSCLWMSRAQLRALVHVLDTCEYPLLIHCAWGSERTGLASAFAELLRPGATLDDARAQFSIRYLFVRAKDGKIMAEHLDQYEAWLRARGEPHHPDRFRRWVAEGFQPGQPGREQWPYDPFPLVVITRPAAPDRPAEEGREAKGRVE